MSAHPEPVEGRPHGRPLPHLQRPRMTAIAFVETLPAGRLDASPNTTRHPTHDNTSVNPLRRRPSVDSNPRAHFQPSPPKQQKFVYSFRRTCPPRQRQFAMSAPDVGARRPPTPDAFLMLNTQGRSANLSKPTDASPQTHGASNPHRAPRGSPEGAAAPFGSR